MWWKNSKAAGGGVNGGRRLLRRPKPLYLIDYNDGEVEWAVLATETYRLLPPDGGGDRRRLTTKKKWRWWTNRESRGGPSEELGMYCRYFRHPLGVVAGVVRFIISLVVNPQA